MNVQIKNLRKSIDANIFEAERLGDFEWTQDSTEDELKSYGLQKRALALVKTKLEEAKMWAGKVLEASGSTLPAEFRDRCDARINGDIKIVEENDDSISMEIPEDAFE